MNADYSHPDRSLGFKTRQRLGGDGVKILRCTLMCLKSSKDMLTG